MKNYQDYKWETVNVVRKREWNQLNKIEQSVFETLKYESKIPYDDKKPFSFLKKFVENNKECFKPKGNLNGSKKLN